MKLIDYTSELFKIELGGRCILILNIAQQLIPFSDEKCIWKTARKSAYARLIYSLKGLAMPLVKLGYYGLGITKSFADFTLAYEIKRTEAK